MRCPHNAACLGYLEDVDMWALACPTCGIAAYGISVAAAFRVFRGLVPRFVPGRSDRPVPSSGLRR